MRRQWVAGLGLVFISILAFAVRSLSLRHVFTGWGEVILRGDDAQYHARRALYGMVNFPEILRWDPYLDHPTGAFIPWPPLYDFSLAAVGRALGNTPAILDQVLAWAPVTLGALTVFAVYAAARAVEGRGVALGAASIFAVLPIAARYAAVGNPDHHAAVAFEGGWLVAFYLWSLRLPNGGRWLWASHAGIVLARASLMLTWQGSLLYLALGETALLCIAGAGVRRGWLMAYAIGAWATALLITPEVALSEMGIREHYSVIELSRMHVAVLLAFGAIAAGVAGWERWKPAGRWEYRLVRVVASIVGLGLAFLAFSGPRDGVAAALAYAGKADPWMAGNLESGPLFSGGTAKLALRYFGYIAFVIPIAPLAVLWRARERQVREAAIFLAFWTASFGVMALFNTRYGNDFAPAGAVAVAVAIAQVGRFAGRRLWGRKRLAGVLSAGLGVILLWPAIALHASGVPQMRQYLAAALRREVRYDQVNYHRDLTHFALRVRESTPETAGFLDASAVPEYGILTMGLLGYIVSRVSERPTTSSGFGPYLGGNSFQLSNRFYALHSEERAFALARRLKARYVITSPVGRPTQSMMLHRLHSADGLGEADVPPLHRFRLVTEWPKRGMPLGALNGTAPFVTEAPFKLFEVVEGAVLTVAADSGDEVTAEVEVSTPTGRRFHYRVSAVANDLGIATLRVPYATDTDSPTRPTGPYRVRIGERIRQVSVSDADVRGGRVVRVPR